MSSASGAFLMLCPYARKPRQHSGWHDERVEEVKRM
jgi:hypothetical protein